MQEGRLVEQGELPTLMGRGGLEALFLAVSWLAFRRRDLTASGG